MLGFIKGIFIILIYSINYSCITLHLVSTESSSYKEISVITHLILKKIDIFFYVFPITTSTATVTSQQYLTVVINNTFFLSLSLVDDGMHGRSMMSTRYVWMFGSKRISGRVSSWSLERLIKPVLSR